MSRCLLCLGDPGDGLGFCGPCTADLPWFAGGLEAEIPLGAAAEPWRSVLAPFHYAFPVDVLIRQGKYAQQWAGLRALSIIAGRSALCERLQTTELVVPVPTSWRRGLSRGFNPALLVARPFARAADREISTRVLRRVRDGKRQARLTGSARRLNMVGAFTAANVAGRTVAVVDDVCTTGSTLSAACHALTLAGARSVLPIALARVR